MNESASSQTPHPPTQGPPTEDLEAVLREMESLEAELSRKEAPRQAPDFSPPPTIDPEALLGPGVGKLTVSVYYQALGYLADRPTLHDYVPDPTLELQGGLAEATFAKFFPGDSLKNYPEYILLGSVAISTWMALNVAPTSSQLATGDGQPAPAMEGEKDE